MIKIIFILLTSIILQADFLTVSQQKILNNVRSIARTMPDNRGVTYETTMAAICLRESSAETKIVGDIAKGDTTIINASLGHMQVRVETAKYVADYNRRHKKKEFKSILEKNDLEIARKLLTDFNFSTRIAITYFLINRNRFKRNGYFKAISLYNGGIKNYEYVNKVLNNVKEIKKYVRLKEII